MSNELDKLAAELRKLKPSKNSRASAMETAMSAFSDEFLPETAAAKVNAKNEKKLDVSQGLTAEPRPTGQSITESRVQTFGRTTMSKFNTLINFKPQTMMMAGSCAAALIAGMIILPNMGELGLDGKAIQSVEAPADSISAEVKASEGAKIEPSPTPSTVPQADEVVVTGSRAAESTVQAEDPRRSIQRTIPSKTSTVTRRVEKADGTFENVTESVVTQDAATETVTIPAVPSPATAPAPEPKVQSGIQSVDDLLNEIRKNAAKVQAENSQAQNDAFKNMSKAEQDAAIREYRAVQQQKDNIALFESQQNIFTPPSPQPEPLPAPRGELDQVLSIAKSSTTAASAPPPPPPTLATLPQFQLGFSGTGAAKPSDGTAPSTPLPEKLAGLTVEQGQPEFQTVTETVVIQEASTELVTIPAEFETVTETVVVSPAAVEYETVPPEYEWVEGDIDGSAIEYETTPAEYETYVETVVVQEASSELVTIPPTFETVQETILVRPSYVAQDGSIVPPETKEVARRVIKTPASTQERTIPAVTKVETRRRVKTPASVVEHVVPYEKKDGKTRVPVKPAATVERAVPAVTKEVKRRVIKTPSRTVERTRPRQPQTYERQVLVQPKIYLRDEDGNVVREFESRDAFEFYKSNVPTAVQEKPVSTFSVDVDTSSYSFLRASVNRGQLPPPSAIRLEEMINYFPYDYDAPKSADEPFKANVTVTSNPWHADKKLMHIGIKGYVPTQDEKPRSNLVFLIDTSGSMNQANKLPLLINSFKLLLNTLDEDDTVSIVAYASASGTVLEPTAVRDKSEILAALNNLRAGGSTAGAAGLELAYKNAEENFDDEGINRVILATDGDFNVGFSSPDDMKKFISKKRDTGIFLSVLGFGMGNYNDHLMQSLAQNGNGVAAYIDNLAEAQKVLANEAGSALITIAKDVKIQVEFNPATVAEYRLIGYETRALKRQDFNNDKVDAGEIGAGHSVTAIYEMTPVGSPAVTVDKLRYVAEKIEPETTGSDEYAFVKIRHKLPNADKSTLQTFPIGEGQETSLRRASDDMRFATAVAIVGQKLRGDVQVEDYSYEDAIELAVDARGEDKNGYRAEFIQMVRLIDGLGE